MTRSRRRRARSRSWWRRLSLRGRLTVIAAAAVAVAVIAVSGTSWLIIEATLHRGFDAQLRSYAQLAVAAPDPQAALRSLTSVQRDDGNRGAPSRLLVVQFLADDGARTGSAGGQVSDLPVTPAARAVATGSTSPVVETVTVAGQQFRVCTLPRPGGAVQVGRGLDGLEDTLSKVALINGLVAVAGVAIAALFGWGVARTALRPVDVLTAGVQRVASTQDFSGPVPVHGSGEIANLASAFNRMLSALAGARQAQRRLIEDASHELRTPLASLRHNVEFLLHVGRTGRTAPPLEEQVALLEDIDSQTIELTALIDELVELAKEEAAPEPLDRVDLAAVVTAALDRVRPNAPHVGFRVATEEAVVVGRPQSLERAVGNLLYNAAKWSPPDGSVEVTVAVRAGDGVITVADEGPGIAEADLPHVFERFYRAAGARALPGSGLGLAIVDQVVTSHGGSVTAGRTPAGGAVLTISLPLAERGQPLRGE